MFTEKFIKLAICSFGLCLAGCATTPQQNLGWAQVLSQSGQMFQQRPMQFQHIPAGPMRPVIIQQAPQVQYQVNPYTNMYNALNPQGAGL